MVKISLHGKKNYRTLLVGQVGGELLEENRANTDKSMAVVNDRFHEEIEKLTGRRLKPKKRGRSSGCRKERFDFFSSPLPAQEVNTRRQDIIS